MNDILAVLFGVALGVLASVPVAMVIAASTTPRPRYDDLPALDVPAVEVPGETGVIVWQVTP